jgi:hypothetical protein
MRAFWDIVPCSLIEVGRQFRGATASIVRTIHKPLSKHQFEVKESVGPLGKGGDQARKVSGEASQLLKGAGCIQAVVEKSILNKEKGRKVGGENSPLLGPPVGL